MELNKSEHQQKVEAFMKGVGQEVNQTPRIPDLPTRIRVARLIVEEVFETLHAMGLCLVSDDGDYASQQTPLADYNTVVVPSFDDPGINRKPTQVNLEKVADGFADISVVNTGGMSAFGMSDIPILREVDENNLLKVATGHKDPATGKWIKPKDHPCPNIKKCLKDQGWNPGVTSNETLRLSGNGG